MSRPTQPLLKLRRLCVAALTCAVLTPMMPAAAEPTPEPPASPEPTGSVAAQRTPTPSSDPDPTETPELAAPTIFTPSPRPVGVVATFHGTFDTDRAIDVWGEVQLTDGSWSRTPTVRSDANGNYSLDITYGQEAGTYLWRVAGKYADGSIMRTTEFTYVRLNKQATVFTPSPRLVFASADITGQFFDSQRIQVWGEVKTPSGRWSPSVKVMTDAQGNYRIPMNYGKEAPGIYLWRVVGIHSNGRAEYTKNFTYKRLHAAAKVQTPSPRPAGADASITGRFSTAKSMRVWAEVRTPSGRWSPTPKVVTDSKGRFAIPMNYGKNSAGVLTWRVKGIHADGTTETTRSFTYRRTATNLDPRCMSGRVLCASKSQRKLRWVIDGKVVATMDARFGRRGYPTREGTFKVYRKSRNHVSGIYGTAMPWAMFFSGGQAVHYSSNFARVGWSGGSAGCINIRDARTLNRVYGQVRTGDKVVVYK